MKFILRVLLLAFASSSAGAAQYMVATANRHASRAGIEILQAGGSALDAAIAAQMVLNLVEPQSSGIGGGAFVLHWDEARKRISAYDGRETAPAAARPDRFLRPDGTPMGIGEAIASGRSVGVPGALRVLALAHGKHGRLPWRRLFEPAIRLAEEGFAVSPRLQRLIAADPLLRRNAAARAYFCAADGSALPVGHRLKNPEFAAVLRRVARDGPDAFYAGEIARDIVAAQGDLVAAGRVDVVHLSVERLAQARVMRPLRVLQDDLLIEVHQSAVPNSTGTRSRAVSNASTSATVLYAAKLARVEAVTPIRRCSGQAQW